MKTRKKVSKTTAQAVELKCRRICALCWATYGVGIGQRGQIAHADRDSRNNDESNLVWLCVSCHDEYDSTPRQTRRMGEATLLELKAITEADVLRGKIPRPGTPHSAVLDLEIKRVLWSEKYDCLDIWIKLANTGERATGLRNIELLHAEYEFGLKYEVKQALTQFHPDASFIKLESKQMVEPGQLTWWGLRFGCTGPDGPCREVGKVGVISLADPLLLRIVPVIGPAVAEEFSDIDFVPKAKARKSLRFAPRPDSYKPKRRSIWD